MQYLMHVIDKLEKEWFFFKKHLINIVIGLILAFYVGGGIGRNIAYYRNVQGPRLQDLGYDLIPEINDQYNFISEVILWTINVIGFGILFVPIFHHPQRQVLSTINMGVRILNVLVIGNFLRPIMYLGTSLPSPADHCMPGSPTYDPPTTVLEIFTHYSSVSGNCGDLIFSGHTLQDMILLLHVYRHSKDIFLGSNKARIILTSVMSVLIALQLIFIIASRNHYTVDVVVGLYVSSTLWYIYNNKFPKDKKIEGDDKSEYYDISEFNRDGSSNV